MTDPLLNLAPAGRVPTDVFTEADWSVVHGLKCKAREVACLHDLLATLLPPVNNNHRNSGNEICYVATTLRTTLRQTCGIILTREEIAHVLYAEGYRFFCRSGLPVGSPSFIMEARGMPTADGTGLVRSHKLLYKGLDSEYVYVNVDGHRMRMLRCTHRGMPANAAPEKMDAYKDLVEDLRRFGEKYKETAEE